MKVGWWDYARRGSHKGGGGGCLKYLKRGWKRKDGRGNKDFKKEIKLVQQLGALNKGGWNPLINYAVQQYSMQGCMVDL